MCYLLWDSIYDLSELHDCFFDVISSLKHPKKENSNWQIAYLMKGSGSGHWLLLIAEVWKQMASWTEGNTQSFMLWKMANNNHMWFYVKVLKHEKNTSLCEHAVLQGVCPHVDWCWSLAYDWFILMIEAAATVLSPMGGAGGGLFVSSLEMSGIETGKCPTNCYSPPFVSLLKLASRSTTTSKFG